MNPEAQKEHQWLQSLVGQWTYETETSEPGGPTEKCTGIENVRSLGGLWVMCEGRGEMPGGGTADTVMTIGYEPRKGRFVGSWVGSMMTWLWVYEGSLATEARALTLETMGPSFITEGQPVAGKLAKYRDTIEFISDDHRMLISQVLDEDGVWHAFMRAHYRRH